MKNFFTKTIISMLIIFISQLSFGNDLIAPHGKYGQTWMNGNLVYEIYYSSTEECVKNTLDEIKNDPNSRRAVIETKTMALFCADSHSPKKKLDDAGLATGGLTYEGKLIKINDNKIYSIWFIDKKICEILKNELIKNKSQKSIICQ